VEAAFPRREDGWYIIVLRALFDISLFNFVFNSHTKKQQSKTKNGIFRNSQHISRQMHIKNLTNNSCYIKKHRTKNRKQCRK